MVLIRFSLPKISPHERVLNATRQLLIQNNREARFQARLPFSKYLQSRNLRGVAGALHFFALERLLTSHVDLDLLRLGFGFLGKLNLQDSLVIVRLHAFGINRVRKSEGTSEAAILPFDSAEVLLFLFLFELALAVNGQRVVLDLDVNVLLVNSRNFDLQRDIVLVLIDV